MSKKTFHLRLLNFWRIHTSLKWMWIWEFLTDFLRKWRVAHLTRMCSWAVVCQIESVATCTLTTARDILMKIFLRGKFNMKYSCNYYYQKKYFGEKYLTSCTLLKCSWGYFDDQYFGEKYFCNQYYEKKYFGKKYLTTCTSNAAEDIFMKNILVRQVWYEICLQEILCKEIFWREIFDKLYFNCTSRHQL